MKAFVVYLDACGECERSDVFGVALSESVAKAMLLHAEEMRKIVKRSDSRASYGICHRSIVQIKEIVIDERQ